MLDVVLEDLVEALGKPVAVEASVEVDASDLIEADLDGDADVDVELDVFDLASITL